MSAETPPATSGKFARWTIWAMAAIGVTACLAVIGITLTVLGFSFFGRAGAPAKVEARTSQEVFTISNVSAVPGTRLISMDVQASSDDGEAYASSRSGSDRRNVVLLDTATGTSRRILEDNGRRITDFRFLPSDGDENLRDSPAKPSGSKSVVPSWYLVTIDRPGDTRQQDVLLGAIASPRQAVVLSGIDGIDAAWLADETHVALIVRDHRKLSYRLIDTLTFKVSAAHPIAID